MLLGLCQTASAQEDENDYKQYVQQRDRQKKGMVQHISPGKLHQSSPAAQRTAACDLSANGDFEAYSTAPSVPGNLGDKYSAGQLVSWDSPTNASPDYLSLDGTNVDTRPQEETGVTGSSTLYSGRGEIGLYSRQMFTEVVNGATITRQRYSEYATSRLSLTNGLENAQYYAEMRVSLSHATLACNYGITNGFGMWFTADDDFSNYGLTDFLNLSSYPPQHIFNASTIGQNAINNGNLGSTTWQRISGQIHGNGEKFVTIGSFNSDASNLAPLLGKNSQKLNSYVFVDDFQIYKIPTAGTPPAPITCGNSVTIGEGCAIQGALYTWSAPGVTGLPMNTTTIQTTVTPTTKTTYTLTVNLPDGSTYASDVTVTIAPVPKAFNRGVVRVGGSCYYDYQIDPVPGPASYSIQLSNGDTGTGYMNGTTGGYIRFDLMEIGPATVDVTVTITTSCGSSTTTFANRFIPAPPKNCFYRPLATKNAAQLETLSAYPNPATSLLTIEIDPALRVESAQVLSMTGQQVLNLAVNSNVFTLKTEALPAGLYLLRVSTSSGVLAKTIQVTAP